MTTLFMVCAIVGGAVLAFQLAMMLIGLGGEALDFDVPDDMDGAMSADLDVDVDVDVDVDAVDAGDITDVDHPHPVASFRVLSFRTVVAALTFFGLGGLLGESTGYPAPVTLAVAAIFGFGAMYGVYWLFRGVRKLQAEGTAKIQRAVGRPATVYVPIPANKSGTGKIQCNLQNRTMEYLAVTPGDRLATGAKVMVTGIITLDTVEVEPAPESERSEHV